jgi:hypothetical protein
MLRRFGVMAVALLAGSCASVGDAKTGFDLVYLGRDAIFVENSTLLREGSVVSFRALRVQDSQFKAGEAVFLGGYARTRIDCATHNYRLLTFQSLQPGFVTGPESVIRGDGFVIAGGSPEEAIAKAVCDHKPAYKVQAASMAEADWTPSSARSLQPDRPDARRRRAWPQNGPPRPCEPALPGWSGACAGRRS